MLIEFMAIAKLHELYDDAARHTAERELKADAQREKADRKGGTNGDTRAERALAHAQSATQSLESDSPLARIPWG
jgi:hypothetical protein